MASNSLSATINKGRHGPGLLARSARFALPALIACVVLSFPATLQNLPGSPFRNIHRFPIRLSASAPSAPVPAAPADPTPAAPAPPLSIAQAVSLLYPEFPLPEELTPHVAFWTEIFTRYSRRQVVLHDRWYLNVIFAVVDMDEGLTDGRTGWEAVGAARDRCAELLTAVGEKWDRPDAMTGPERMIRERYAGVAENPRFPFRQAADRVHAQVGQADAARDGIAYSGRYMTSFEAIFSDHGLPVALSRLPLIESAFNPKAVSHAGAAGMWQFMPGTGRRFGLSIDRLVDERRDPLLACRAAARLLAANYKALGEWPLAITAYNHGVQGMKNAVAAVGDRSIARIIEEYENPRFGFASRNFYVEFLAAAAIYDHADHFFPGIRPDPPLALSAIALDHYVTVATLRDHCGVPEELFRQLNPALLGPVYTAGGLVPKGYRLNLPTGDRTRFKALYAALPDHLKKERPPTILAHKVRRNQTLSDIAQSHGITVRGLMRLNNIRNPNHIRVGQSLSIPARTGIGNGRGPGETSVGPGNRHRVKHGQTLSGIARLYNTTTGAILRANAIDNPSRIMAGQMLVVPGG